MKQKSAKTKSLRPAFTVDAPTYQPKYKELENIVIVYYEEHWAEGTRILPVHMEADRSKKSFRQRLEESYEALLDADATKHHIQRLYFLSVAECASLAKFLATQDRLIAQGISQRTLEKEIWIQLYAERKKYLQESARVVEWGIQTKPRPAKAKKKKAKK